MRTIVVTPPTDPVVTPAQTKAAMVVEHDDDDALITAYIAAATANLDGPDGWLGRALGAQTLEARYDNFTGAPLILSCPPIAAIASVKYIDQDGAEQTIDPANYALLERELVAAYGFTWPRPRQQREAVRIRYSAGYTAGDPAGTLSPAITAAILLMTGDLYAHRESAIAGDRAASVEIKMSLTVENLLAPLRIYA